MTLVRYPTASPDHFVCRCGYWCLASSCPLCETPDEERESMSSQDDREAVPE